MTDEPLPSAAEAEHLTVALRRAGVLSDGFVSGVVVDSSRDTLLSRIRRLRLFYRGASDAPDTVIFKTGLPACADDAMDVGRREVEFYTQVAAVMPARLVPRCFGAEWRVDTSDWHILLEDLGDSHVIATQWPLPPTVAQCESIMRARARFHAAWWDDPRLGASVGARLKVEHADREAQRLAEQFKRFAEQMGDSLPRKSFELVERLLEAAPRLLARAAVRDNLTIVHGDAHVWNCFLPRDPGSDDTRLFDWIAGASARRRVTSPT
jgi:hypothetical protein